MNANILTRFQFNELNGDIQLLPHLPIVVYTIPLWRRAFIRNVTSHIRYFGTNLLRIRMVGVNFKRMKNWRKVEKCRFFVEIQTPWQTFLCGEKFPGPRDQENYWAVHCDFTAIWISTKLAVIWKSEQDDEPLNRKLSKHEQYISTLQILFRKRKHYENTV